MAVARLSLRLSDGFRFDEVAQHGGGRRRRDGVVGVLVGADEIAQRIEVDLGALVERPLGEQVIHDPLRLLEIRASDLIEASGKAFTNSK